MNIISISGNLGKDCEVRSLSDGTQIASFSVADSQGKDGMEGTDDDITNWK